MCPCYRNSIISARSAGLGRESVTLRPAMTHEHSTNELANPKENPAKTERLNTKAAGIIALAVMGSRILGLAREQIVAGLFGAGRVMDAFTAAFRIPNLLRDLFAEGALSTSFVTV